MQYTFVALAGILLFLDHAIIWFPPMVIAYIIPSIIPGDLGIPIEAQQQAMSQRPFVVRSLVSLSVIVLASLTKWFGGPGTGIGGIVVDSAKFN